MATFIMRANLELGCPFTFLLCVIPVAGFDLAVIVDGLGAVVANALVGISCFIFSTLTSESPCRH